VVEMNKASKTKAAVNAQVLDFLFVLVDGISVVFYFVQISQVLPYLVGWVAQCSVVEHQSLTGELSLVCTGPAADR